jgi:hypothetical protein
MRHLPWLALILVSIAAQLGWMDATVGTYDEGLVLVGAERVLRGELPYRDFWTLYGPGSFYVLAGLYSLFGELVLVERGFDIATKTAIVTLVFAVVLQFHLRAVAFGAGVLSLGLLLYLRSYSAPLFPAMAASLAAVLAVYKVSLEPRPRPAFVAGVAVGVTTCFRHDLGAYALLAWAGFLIHLAWTGRGDPGPRRPGAWAAAGWLAAGMVLSLGPVIAFFAASVPAADLYRDFVEIPLSVYPRVRALPFPPIVDALAETVRTHSPGPLGPLIVYLPLIVIGTALGSEFLRPTQPDGRGRVGLAQDTSAQTRLFRFLLLLGALFYVKGLVRVSPLHVGASLIVSIVLLGASIARARSPMWRTGLAVAGGLALLALLAKPLVTGAERATDGLSAAAVFADRWMTHASTLCREPIVPRLRCFRLEPDATAVAAYLVQHGASGQRVYVGLGRHDKIFAANLALTFAVAAIPPTRWHDLHPGVQTRADVQAQMIEELRAAPLAYAVLDDQWDLVTEPNDSALSSGVTALDDYLAGHFEPVFRAGSLTVLRPRSGLPG